MEGVRWAQGTCSGEPGPSPADVLQQQVGRRQLPAAQRQHAGLGGEHGGLRAGHVEVAHRAGLVRVQHDVLIVLRGLPCRLLQLQLGIELRQRGDARRTAGGHRFHQGRLPA
jgi:hypothetical protein